MKRYSTARTWVFQIGGVGWCLCALAAAAAEATNPPARRPFSRRYTGQVQWDEPAKSAPALPVDATPKPAEEREPVAGTEILKASGAPMPPPPPPPPRGRLPTPQEEQLWILAPVEAILSADTAETNAMPRSGFGWLADALTAPASNQTANVRRELTLDEEDDDAAWQTATNRSIQRGLLMVSDDRAGDRVRRGLTPESGVARATPQTQLSLSDRKPPQKDNEPPGEIAAAPESAAGQREKDAAAAWSLSADDETSPFRKDVLPPSTSGLVIPDGYKLPSAPTAPAYPSALSDPGARYGGRGEIFSPNFKTSWETPAPTPAPGAEFDRFRPVGSPLGSGGLGGTTFGSGSAPPPGRAPSLSPAAPMQPFDDSDRIR